MLAYAAGRQRIAARRSSPSTMLLIIGGHVAAVAIVMSVKMAVDHQKSSAPTEITLIEPERIPPPPPPEPQPRQDPVETRSNIFVPDPPLPVPQLPTPDIGTTADPVPPAGAIIGSDPQPPIQLPLPKPALNPVRIGARLATPASALRPPYPSSKLDSQEEAALKLRLSIDERGRVVAVEPVGPADAAFLASARRHLIAKWRYQPASVDGRPVASTTVITLRFQLEG
jgi:periplasmic protein TonB